MCEGESIYMKININMWIVILKMSGCLNFGVVESLWLVWGHSKVKEILNTDWGTRGHQFETPAVYLSRSLLLSLKSIYMYKYVDRSGESRWQSLWTWNSPPLMNKHVDIWRYTIYTHTHMYTEKHTYVHIHPVEFHVDAQDNIQTKVEMIGLKHDWGLVLPPFSPPSHPNRSP